jgi:DNA-damage-inducible protein J
MPTIQVRIDDQTKTASTALFDQLGMSMSEAISLFLRQSIMRGGIPFTLTVPGKQETNTDILEDEVIIDALKRYKSVNNKPDFDIAKIEPFFITLKNVDYDNTMRMTLQENAVKVRLKYKDKDYVLDYNFEQPDNVFILTRKDGKLFVKDCKLSKILETLKDF